MIPDTGRRSPAPIPILEFVNGFAIGGTERQVVNLARGLDRSRFDLHVACFKRWGQYLEEMESCGAPIVEYPIDSLHNLRTVRHQWRLASDLRRRGVRLVHAYNFYANVFAIPVARLAGVPVVVASVRDTGLYLTPAQKCAQTFVCRLADRVLVNAEAVRSSLVEQGLPAHCIEVIPNGIDMSRFTRPRGPGRIRRELGLPDRAPVVAVLGRLHAMKGLDDFLHAAAAVASRVREARFLVVGDRLVVKDGAVVGEPQIRRELQALADRLGLGGRLIFTGYRLDVPDLLAEIDLSVLPSHSEGLSNVLLESMAAGVPVVATRVGGTPEAIVDGLHGVLVPPRDPELLAGAIERVLADPCLAERLARAGRDRIAARYSLQAMVSATQRLYLDLADGRARGARLAAGPPALQEDLR